MLKAGLTALTKYTGRLGEVWSVMTKPDPKGAFFSKLRKALDSGGYELNANTREVKRNGRVVVRPPSTDKAETAVAAARAPDDGNDHRRSAVAALLTGHGARPPITDEVYCAAVRLHCGLSEPSTSSQLPGAHYAPSPPSPGITGGAKGSRSPRRYSTMRCGTGWHRG